MRPIRFGYQITGNIENDPVTAALKAEQAGFDTVLVADHVGAGNEPLAVLAAIAASTTRIRLGTLVLNNDMRNSVQLAWAAATIDGLSDGRFELGLGAGHTPHEYAETGIDLDLPLVRKERLAESVEVIRRLLDGEELDHHGAHYRLKGARIRRPVQDRIPIMVAGNGPTLLRHAAAHADIVGLSGLGRTLEDGHDHEMRWSAAHLDDQIAQIRAGASGGEMPELNSLVQRVIVTDDRDAALRSLCDEVAGLDPGDAAATPYLLIGTTAQIVDQVHAARDRWGISYFSVRELEAMVPVIDAVRAARQTDRGSKAFMGR